MRTLLLLAALLLCSAPALADTTDSASDNTTSPTKPAPVNASKTAPNFEKLQKRWLDGLDKRIQALEDIRDCIAAATDVATMSDCKPAPANANSGKSSSEADKVTPVSK